MVNRGLLYDIISTQGTDQLIPPNVIIKVNGRQAAEWQLRNGDRITLHPPHGLLGGNLGDNDTFRYTRALLQEDIKITKLKINTVTNTNNGRRKLHSRLRMLDPQTNNVQTEIEKAAPHDDEYRIYRCCNMANALITARQAIHEKKEGIEKGELEVPPLYYSMPHPNHKQEPDSKYPPPEASKHGILSLLTQLQAGRRAYAVSDCENLSRYYGAFPEERNIVTPKIQLAWTYYDKIRDYINKYTTSKQLHGTDQTWKTEHSEWAISADWLIPSKRPSLRRNRRR